MVILLKGVLKTLDYFIDCMSGEWEEEYVLDISDPAFFRQLLDLDTRIDENTDVITFNNVGVSVVLSNGQNYWEVKKVRLHNIYVDDPILYITDLEKNLKCMQIVTVDRYHKKFIDAYFPAYDHRIQFLPHGGARLDGAEVIAYEERQIEVLYVGARSSSISTGQEFPYLPGNGRELFDVADHLLRKYPFLTMEKIYDLYMSEINMELDCDRKLIVLRKLYEESICSVRGYYQKNVIEALASAGIHVEIYSSRGWKEVEEKYPHYIHVHEVVEPEECIKLMCNSKITLNILPWFKYGAHERIYNAMLNGSVCVSDTSEYLETNFDNGKNIVLYKLDQLDGLVQNVQMLLSSPEYAKHIIENQKKAVANSTWKDRKRAILERRFEG